MAAYATSTDVSFLLNYTFSTSSTPTSAEINEICTQLSGEVETYLTMAGVTSVSSTSLVDLLKNKVAMGAAAQVALSFTDEKTRNLGTFYYGEYKDFLNTIKETPEIFTREESGTYINISSVVLDGTVDEDDYDPIDDYQDLKL